MMQNTVNDYHVDDLTGWDVRVLQIAMTDELGSDTATHPRRGGMTLTHGSQRGNITK